MKVKLLKDTRYARPNAYNYLDPRTIASDVSSHQEYGTAVSTIYPSLYKPQKHLSGLHHRLAYSLDQITIETSDVHVRMLTDGRVMTYEI